MNTSSLPNIKNIFGHSLTKNPHRFNTFFSVKCVDYELLPQALPVAVCLHSRPRVYDMAYLSLDTSGDFYQLRNNS